MKSIARSDMIALINEWRAVVPKRPLTFGEHIQFEREQALHVRALADENEPAINLIWLFNQTAIPVHYSPGYTLSENSGLTTDRVEDKLQIFLNEKEPHRRHRFSLLHEWKHALDFYDQTVLYQKLGDGDADEQNNQIEAIANDFAAHVLMPTELVITVWFDTRSIAKAADIFEVSRPAMQTRLEILGLIGQPKPRPHDRFRPTSLIYETDSDPTLCAA
jgi:IrrE N-terminal-like domain